MTDRTFILSWDGLMWVWMRGVPSWRQMMAFSDKNNLASPWTIHELALAGFRNLHGPKRKSRVWRLICAKGCHPKG